MGFLDYFRSSHRNSAAVARERLQIIVAHERGRSSAPDYLPLLQKDELQAVRKYVSIDEDRITVSVDRSGDCEVLELNITLPDEGQNQGEAPPRTVSMPKPAPRPGRKTNASRNGGGRTGKRRKSRRR